MPSWFLTPRKRAADVKISNLHEMLYVPRKLSRINKGLWGVVIINMASDIVSCKLTVSHLLLGPSRRKESSVRYFGRNSYEEDQVSWWQARGEFQGEVRSECMSVRNLINKMSVHCVGLFHLMAQYETKNWAIVHGCCQMPPRHCVKLTGSSVLFKVKESVGNFFRHIWYDSSYVVLWWL